MQNAIPRHNPQTLQVYLYYRLALSGLLVVMFYSGIASSILGTSHPKIYLYCSLAYFTFSLASFFVFPPKSLLNSQKRIAILLFIDIAVLLILIHLSGGISSGLGYLLIVSAAMTSFFIQGQLVFAFSAFIALAIIANTFYLFRDSEDFIKNIFASGVLGTLVFSTTTALFFLTSNIRKKSAEAEEQARYISNLHEIAQNIVTRMQTGVIVVNSSLKIELMNASAKQMLEIPDNIRMYGEGLSELRELAPLLKSWETILQEKKSSVMKLRRGTEVQVSVARLETGNITKNIFYLDDYLTIKQQAQQLKLASLGRLAASIAHEIRNPLGALSHAAQLMSESEDINNSDKRMIEIILNNSRRVNEIVENTLSLSRRQEPLLQRLDLAEWLPQFLTDSQAQHKKAIVLDTEDDSLLTRFDPTHLSQILNNLIENGLRYSEKATGIPEVTILAKHIDDDEKTFIEIIDNGVGISYEDVTRIFEPFFTTDINGSGLGLYISKELAEINRASLHYRRTADGKSCFRLNLPHYQRTR